MQSRSYVPALGDRRLSPFYDATIALMTCERTWRRAAAMADRFAHVPVRSLPPWQTAYPRASKLYEDPAGGLATIEALFAAYHILARDTAGLLGEYHWAGEFLQRNAERIESRDHVRG